MSPRRKSPVIQPVTEPEHCSVDLRLRLLGRLPFFAGLAPAELAQVNRLFGETGYQPGEIVYRSGEPASHLYVVAEGRVKLLSHTLAGKNVLLDLLGQGEFFGSLAGLGEPEYAETAQVLAAGCILNIGAEDFRKVLEAYPSVTLKVLETLAGRLQAARERVHQLSVLPAEKRIAQTLLRLGEKLGRPAETGLLIHTPLTRDDLAELTGSTPETASRVISQLQRAGLVHSGRGWVAIADPEGLAKYAGEF